MEIVANPTMHLILRAQLDSMGDAHCTLHTPYGYPDDPDFQLRFYVKLNVVVA